MSPRLSHKPCLRAFSRIIVAYNRKLLPILTMALPLSPKSCTGGARTCTSTPETALVREDLSTSHFSYSEMSPPVLSTTCSSNLRVRSVVEEDKDPFVTAMSNLSPTAVAFQPVNIRERLPASLGYPNGLFSHELGMSRSLVLSTSVSTSRSDAESLLTVNNICHWHEFILIAQVESQQE